MAASASFCGMAPSVVWEQKRHNSPPADQVVFAPHFSPGLSRRVTRSTSGANVLMTALSAP
jgi:hypothetical protein